MGTMRQIKRSYLSKVLIVLFMLSNLFGSFGFPRDRVSADAIVEEGDYVTFGSYGGQPLKWQVIKIDANGYMLFAADSIGKKPFDARGDGTDGRSDTDRIDQGSSYWERSNLREWLNSSEQTVTYSHQPPDAAHVIERPYNEEPGFLSDGNFTSHERALIQPVTHKAIIAPIDISVSDGGSENHDYNTGSAFADGYVNYDNGFYKYTTDYVFVPSIPEIIELAARDAAEDGKDFPHSSSIYWVRDAMTYFSRSVRIVFDTYFNSTSAHYAFNVRPVLYLKAGVV